MGDAKFGGFLVKENINQFYTEKGQEQRGGTEGGGLCVVYLCMYVWVCVCMYVLRHKCMSVQEKYEFVYIHINECVCVCEAKLIARVVATP